MMNQSSSLTWPSPHYPVTRPHFIHNCKNSLSVLSSDPSRYHPFDYETGSSGKRLQYGLEIMQILTGTLVISTTARFYSYYQVRHEVACVIVPNHGAL